LGQCKAMVGGGGVLPKHTVYVSGRPSGSVDAHCSITVDGWPVARSAGSGLMGMVGGRLEGDVVNVHHGPTVLVLSLSIAVTRQ
jgi:hypothetical protein